MSRSAAFYILSGMMVFFCEYSSARYYDLYRADYTKGSYCSAIGGACASDIDFDNSFFQNSASLTAGGADFDYDYDYIEGNNLEPGMKGANSVSETSFMFAIAYSKRNWSYIFYIIHTKLYCCNQLLQNHQFFHEMNR